MDDKVISAIATLLWPLILIGVIFYFRPAVNSVIQSATSRKFALKIGGQELSMEEANQNQQKMITDLQMKVLEVKKRLDGAFPSTGLTRLPGPIIDGDTTVAVLAPSWTGGTTGSSLAPLPGTTGGTPAPFGAKAMAPRPNSFPPDFHPQTILWVDDNPKNIISLIELLRDRGMRVVEATSTAEGLRLLQSRHFDCVISDMRREEGLHLKEAAGLTLLKKVRSKDATLPFIFFTGDGSIAKHGEDAMKFGATEMTSSATDLLGMLNADTLKSTHASAL